MEYISVFDVFKIGVGPSSSHTLGPWKAALDFIHRIPDSVKNDQQIKLMVHLYGSLSLTGKGHATDLAVIMGLAGYEPDKVDTAAIPVILEQIRSTCRICLPDGKDCIFDPSIDIVFEKEFLPYHANGMILKAETSDGQLYSEVYYSLGGGFILREGDDPSAGEHTRVHPFPIQKSDELLNYCNTEQLPISEIVLANERIDRSEQEIKAELLRIWDTMFESMYLGCHTEGYLPGALRVKRRAAPVVKKLIGEMHYNSKEEWLQCIRNQNVQFQDIFKWVSSFAIAVNEVNAAFGRIVTAPTNGSAGVIPAVLMYYLAFVNKHAGEQEIIRYLCVCGEIGSIFKKGSTISAAMGGCQAEIGVSSSMAAAGLAELLGASPEQCIIAAEIAMEHHLGMTCDPIGGLVQVPCIERNSMGAIKAINAAEIAVDRDPADVKVPLDNVISTMWETAKDMHRKYKETSEGGLATAVNIIDC